MNRLLRQYFLKGTDLSRYPQTALNRIVLRSLIEPTVMYFAKESH